MQVQFTAKLVQESLLSFGIYTDDPCLGGGKSNKPFGSKIILLNSRTETDISDKVKRFVSTMEEMNDFHFTEFVELIPNIPGPLVPLISSTIMKKYEDKHILLWKSTESLSYFHKTLQVLKSLGIHHDDMFVDRFPFAELLQKILFSERESTGENYTELYIHTVELACEVLKVLSSLVAESIESLFYQKDLNSLSILEVFTYFCFIGGPEILNRYFCRNAERFRSFLVEKAKTEMKKNKKLEIVSLVNYMDRKVSSV